MSATLDPVAATAAYLAAIPPAVRGAAEARTGAAHWAWAARLAFMLAASWLMVRLDVLVRLRAWVERKSEKPRTAAILCSAATALALVVASTLAGAAVSAVTRQPAPPVPYGLWLVGAIVVLPVVYAVMRLAPRRWWLWLGLTYALFAVYLVWVPFVEAGGPTTGPTVPGGPVKQAILSLAHDSGLKVGEVYLRPSDKVDADVTGLPGRPRVTITQGMLNTLSPAEAKASVGHLIGHYVNQDQLILALTLAVLGIAILFAVDRLFAPLARAMGRGELTLADPTGLAVAAVIAVAAYALAGIAYDNVIRLINVRADQYSLDHAREPDGLAAALVHTDTADKVDPSPVEEALFYDHPALKGRIAHAMRWKAERPDLQKR